jgi:hypothetical protein
MLDLTKPIQTKDGRPVRLISTEGLRKRPIVGAMLQNGRETLISWNENGFYYANYRCDTDIINVPPPKAVVSTTLYLWRSCTGKIFITHSPDLRYDEASQGKSTLLGSKIVTIVESEESQGA